MLYYLLAILIKTEGVFMINRMKTKKVRVGELILGGDKRILIQSMLNTKNGDVKAAIEQSRALVEAGCDIIRLAVTDEESIKCIHELKKAIDVPLVADIQFDYRLALASIDAGIDKVRINPGNIGSDERVREVVKKAKERHLPIRIGVNTGSIHHTVLEKYKKVCPEALVGEAMRHVKILNDNDFDDIVISLKASSVPLMIDAYKLMAKETDYPLHLGVTEAGTVYSGTVKSAVGIGSLLSQGIGDTIRVSLTADPVEEIYAAKEILKSLDLLKNGPTLVSCPTCARCTVDLIDIANEVTERLKTVDKNIKVAVMGCVVNGPGEAKDADIGITGAKGEGLIFKKGEIIRKVPESEIVSALFSEIEKLD